MAELSELLDRHVRDGALPGAVALVARGEDVDLASAGFLDAEGSAVMHPDTIVRIASLSKPITAAALLMLLDDGLAALEDPISRWLPELSEPMVVRRPSGPVDDVVPAQRPITVADLLSSRAGWGMPADFSYPAVQLLFSELGQGPPQPQKVAAPDEWLSRLARIPLLYQPGEAWLYNTCSDLQGVLAARISGRPLPDLLAERVFEPLGMLDTGFEVPAAMRSRLASLYRADDTGLVLVDGPQGQWSSAPTFASGAGGLVSTASDWLSFGRMLLAAGMAGRRRLLSARSVAQMTTDQLSQAQRDAGRLFLEGQGWGFGGSVDVAAVDPWNVPGRYGWVGGTGTSAHIVPADGSVSVLLTQVEMTGPTPSPVMRDFWRCAAASVR